MTNTDLQSYHPSSPQAQQLAEKKGWQDKYRLLIHWADNTPAVGDIRRAENIISGCESAAWLSCRVVDKGRYECLFDSDSRIIKGLAALVLSEVNGKGADEIDNISLNDVVNYCGLGKHLSPSRTNGLRSMLEKLRACLSSHTPKS